MASYLRPRRGKKATAEAAATALTLKRGEVFFEVPTTGVGTGIGKIKMGDGSTTYASLPYFASTEDDVIGFTNTSAATDKSNNPTYLTNIAPTTALKTLFTNLKQLLYNYNSQLTSLNNDLANKNDLVLYSDNTKNIKFGIDDDGNYGYYKDGADTVTPFKTGSGSTNLLYLNGTFNFAYDNPGTYKLNTASAYATSGGASLYSTYMRFTTTSGGKCKCLGSTNLIDFTNYNKVIICTSRGTLEIDTSSITGSYYLAFTLIDYTSNGNSFAVNITSQKDNISNGRVAVAGTPIITTSWSIDVTAVIAL